VIPAFLGRDARELESLINEVYSYKNNYKNHGMPFWNGVAYVEAALLDLLGKVTGRSVGALVGEVLRRDIPIYLSSTRRDTSAEEEVDFMVERVAETGARAVKMKVGGRMRNNADATPGRTERIIALARERLGPEMTIYFDGNGSFDSEKAIEVGRLLEDHKCAFFEEPCPFEQYEATKAVADALDIDVAGGEQDCNMAHFREMIRRRVVDVVQPDMMYNGGLVRALRVARMAAEAGMTTTIHGTRHNPELATILHFASVTPNAGQFTEYPSKHVTFKSWYEPHFVVQPGGTVKLPDGPGLGVSYDEEIWKSARVL
jgi:L-alanine-DL-glutamate epimerase-like enolase superfamily enzyme